MTFKRQLIKEASERCLSALDPRKQIALQFSCTVSLYCIALHFIVVHIIILQYSIALHCKIRSWGWSELLPDINHPD